MDTDILLQDDASALDPDAMRRWVLILRVFMTEYLHLHPEDGKAARSDLHTELVRAPKSSPVSVD
jgi:glutaminyl-peptide cyclotransferase